VEFANQLRDEGKSFDEALIEAARVRLRPIAMTGITTAATSIPLIFSFGAGAETRLVIGVVVLGGVLIATLLTIYLVPLAYHLLAMSTGSPTPSNASCSSNPTENPTGEQEFLNI